MNKKNTTEQTNTPKRGFASMSKEKVAELASKGGHAASESKNKKVGEKK
jgi:general stress protein YciG